MIDWITLRAPFDTIPVEARERVRNAAGRVIRIDRNGEIVWESISWDSIRSDSHQLNVRLGSDLEIMGSPARVMGSDNVFGSDDLQECALAMIRFAARHLSVVLPLELDRWRCTRIDVTHNYLLESPAQVLEALDHLRYAEGGRYRGQSKGATIYWNVRSAHRSGKAYAKGPHLAQQVKRGQANCSDAQVEAAGKLLRLELSLRRHYFDRLEIHWSELTSEQLYQEHKVYFDPLIGDVEVTEMNDNLLKQIEQVEESEGRALAAFRTYSLVRAVGMEQARASMPKSTWCRHQKALLAAGLSFSDLRAGNVVPLRKRRIVLGQPVTDWSQVA